MEKRRVTVPHDDEYYSVLNYVAYVLYPPLYIAGPIMTFNDFMWQVSPGIHVNGLKLTQSLASETTGDTIQHENHVFSPVYGLLPDDGMHTSFHVCCRYQGYEIVDKRFAGRDRHDRILESYHCLAQSKINIVPWLFSY